MHLQLWEDVCFAFSLKYSKPNNRNSARNARIQGELVDNKIEANDCICWPSTTNVRENRNTLRVEIASDSVPDSRSTGSGIEIDKESSFDCLTDSPLGQGMFIIACKGAIDSSQCQSTGSLQDKDQANEEKQESTHL